MQKQDIASAATIYPINIQNVEVSGTADITTISVDYVRNYTTLTIVFTGTAVTNGVVDGSNLYLNGNLTYLPNTTLVIQRRGNFWFELSRSIN